MARGARRDARGIWLKLAKEGASVGSVSYAEAIELGLAHGWIDGQKRALDDDVLASALHAARSAKPLVEDQPRQGDRADRVRTHDAGRARRGRAGKADGRWERAYEGAATITVPGRPAARARRRTPRPRRSSRRWTAATATRCSTGSAKRGSPRPARAGSRSSSPCWPAARRRAPAGWPVSPRERPSSSAAPPGCPTSSAAATSRRNTASTNATTVANPAIRNTRSIERREALEERLGEAVVGVREERRVVEVEPLTEPPPWISRGSRGCRAPTAPADRRARPGTRGSSRPGGTGGGCSRRPSRTGSTGRPRCRACRRSAGRTSTTTVATPMSRGATAFCMASMIVCMIQAEADAEHRHARARCTRAACPRRPVTAAACRSTSSARADDREDLVPAGARDRAGRRRSTPIMMPGDQRQRCSRPASVGDAPLHDLQVQRAAARSRRTSPMPTTKPTAPSATAERRCCGTAAAAAARRRPSAARPRRKRPGRRTPIDVAGERGRPSPSPSRGPARRSMQQRHEADDQRDRARTSRCGGRGACAARCSTRATTTTSATMPIGTLTRKTQRQPAMPEDARLAGEEAADHRAEHADEVPKTARK